MSFQHLRLDLQTEDSQQFAPGQYIYANSDIEASIFVANYVRHVTLFNRPSSVSLAIAGDDIDVDINTKAPLRFIPPGKTPGIAFSESSTGFADPSVQLVVNLFGTPPLKANLAIRTSVSSNVFGDDDLDNSLIRLQLIYAWHKDFENMKKLQQGH